MEPQPIVDKVAANVTYVGSGWAVIFGLSANEFAALVGAAVAVVGLLVNLWFKWQHLRIARTVAATRKQHEDEESCDLKKNKGRRCRPCCIWGAGSGVGQIDGFLGRWEGAGAASRVCRQTRARSADDVQGGHQAHQPVPCRRGRLLVARALRGGRAHGGEQGPASAGSVHQRRHQPADLRRTQQPRA